MSGHRGSPGPPPTDRAARRHRAITRLDYTPPRVAVRHYSSLCVVRARITNSNLWPAVPTVGRPPGRPNCPVSALVCPSPSRARSTSVHACPRASHVRPRPSTSVFVRPRPPSTSSVHVLRPRPPSTSSVHVLRPRPSNAFRPTNVPSTRFDLVPAYTSRMLPLSNIVPSRSYRPLPSFSVPFRPFPYRSVPSRTVPSLRNPSHHIPSHATQSHPIPSHPSHSIQSHPTPSHPIPPQPTLSHPTPSRVPAVSRHHADRGQRSAASRHTPESHSLAAPRAACHLFCSVSGAAGNLDRTDQATRPRAQTLNTCFLLILCDG